MLFGVKAFLAAFFLATILFSSNLVLAESEATVNSKTTFEAFWPLSAGRVMDDPIYFLKIWKENLRGMIAFGNPQKAEYAVLLGTKRILEADKLLQDGKKDLSDQTLNKALEQFDIAQKNLNDLKKGNRALGSSATTIKPRLENLVNLLESIQSDKVVDLLQRIKNLQMDIQ